MSVGIEQNTRFKFSPVGALIEIHFHRLHEFCFVQPYLFWHGWQINLLPIADHLKPQSCRNGRS